VLNELAAARGASLVWRGSYDPYVLGSAGPVFQEMVVTSYPNRAAYINTLSDPAVIERRCCSCIGFVGRPLRASFGDGLF
jgi:hypothetical protein